MLVVAMLGYSLVYLPKVSGEDKSIGNCPSLCTCSQTMVDCSGKDLKSFPTSLRTSTSIL